jgi:uncharacterized membrane protein
MKKQSSAYHIVFIAVMAAIVCIATFLRFPLWGSKVHLGNTAGLLAGLLLGPVSGGLAAGIGSGINDLISGYGLDEVLVTFVSKFLMALICGLIARRGGRVRSSVGAAVGALSYVALYMLKHLVYQCLVYGNPLAAAGAVMVSKLPASLINAVFALIVAPILYAALRPALEKAGLLRKIETGENAD